MALPRHQFLPFGLIARPEFDRWQIRRRLKLDGSAATHAAAHMLHDIRRSAVPTVQREPAPQHAAVHNTAMIAESAPNSHVRAFSPDLFEGFKASSHGPAIGS